MILALCITNGLLAVIVAILYDIRQTLIEIGDEV